VNRLCASGMEAVVDASRALAVGDASVVVAGGVESMSRAPWVMMKPEVGYARGHETLHSTTLGWRMVNPRMPEAWTVALGSGAELLADRHGIGRSSQDAFAVASHRKAHAAWEAGAFDAEVEHLIDDQGRPLLAQDESIRPDTDLERLARLRPSFRPDGTVTAGNASPLNDGAAAVLLAGEAGLARVGGREPLARIAARAVAAVEPQWYGIAPVTAAETALKRAGIGWGDLDVVELNEAFAAQALACLASWPELDPTIVNPNGGAIAIGHPLGASGARIVGTLAWELHRRGARWGLASLCVGVGQGVAVVLEGASS
jgi:acetyl-CoA acetyltransferase family protein